MKFQVNEIIRYQISTRIKKVFQMESRKAKLGQYWMEITHPEMNSAQVLKRCSRNAVIESYISLLCYEENISASIIHLNVLN